ncbi:MAG: response regulator [Alteromonadaceae bacterium]|nr:response regulator [Alteromonadaceae bacterium]
MFQQESDDFIAIKKSLIDRLLFGLLVLIGLVLFGSLYRITSIGFIPIMALHVVIGVIHCLIYLFRQKIPSNYKALWIVGALFVSGLVGLINFGLGASGTMLLAFSVVMAALIFNNKSAIVLGIAGALAQLGVFLLVNYTEFEFKVPMGDYLKSLPAWFNNFTSYALFTAMCVFVIDKFFTYLKTMSAVLQHAVEEKSKELEQSEALLTTVINSFPFGVFWKKKDLTFWGANQRFLDDVKKKSVHEVVGKTDHELSDGNAEEYEAQDAKILETGEPLIDYEKHHIEKDGSESYSNTNKVALRNKRNEIVGLVATYSDITDRKNMEIKLREAIESAHAASKAKSDFLATMSHEIRTPINGVMGLLDLTLHTNLNQTQRDYLTKAEMSAHTLLQIINQILDISKIEAGKMELESIPFKITDIAAQLDSQVRHLAEGKRIGFNVNLKGKTEQMVLGDPTKLMQILVNLTSNGIKFTQEGGVTVSIGALPADDMLKVRITIEDTGIGITEEQQANLFNSFTQADSSTSRKFGGTGLGLAIVKELLTMQKGEIKLDSKPGQGTTFTVLINYEVADESGDDTRKVKTTENISGVKILLAEDNEINQLIATEMLTNAGASVEVAGNGEIALKMLSENHYNLVLMDIQMPVMDGTEALRKIRSNPEWASLPVIALTANVMAHEVKHYQEIGFTAHLGKPFQKEQLLAKINYSLCAL